MPDSSSWTTKQVIVQGKDVNESVTFTKKPEEVKNITVNLSCSSGGGHFYYELTASEPVTTSITATATVSYKEEDTCAGRVVYEGNEFIQVTLTPGQTSASSSLLNGGDACTLIGLKINGSASTPWNGQTINGAKYSATGWWSSY